VTGFPINPPRAPIAGAGGIVSSEWYRYFAQIQAAVGSSASASWQDGFLLGSAPAAMPSVNELQAGAAAVAIGTVTVTTDRSVLDTDCVIRGDATAASLSVILPSAVTWPGRQVIVKKIDATANTVQIAAAGGQTIDGAATLSIAVQYQSYTMVSNGTGWDII